jgi:hypothetical protein
VSSRCGRCGGLIAQVRTPGETRLSIDLEPNPDGNVVIGHRGYAHVLTPEGALSLAPGVPRYTFHEDTCPKAGQP